MAQGKISNRRIYALFLRMPVSFPVSLGRYKELISTLPHLEQAFQTRRSTWQRECEKNVLFQQYCERVFKSLVLKISRADVFEAASEDFYRGLFTLILWGYPRNMRGNTFQDMLEPENLNRIQEALNHDCTFSKNEFLSVRQKIEGTGIGLSTLTKILYFFQFSIEEIPCAIFDKRIIEVCNAQMFSELLVLTKITERNKYDKYYQYLCLIRDIANANQFKPDQLELFLFQFGNNLKPVNVSGSLV